jgi:hypothetical protein
LKTRIFCQLGIDSGGTSVEVKEMAKLAEDLREDESQSVREFDL